MLVNVKDYGAVGDGVTNDTQAFLDALDDLLNTYGKGVLYCPSGNYKILQQLEIDKPFVGIKGDGIQATKLSFPAGSGLQLSSAADFSLAAVEDISIWGPGHSGSGIYNFIGIDMPASNYYFLNRFQVVNFDIGVAGSIAVLNRFENFTVEGCKVGMQFSNGSYMNTVFNGNVRGCWETGIYESGSRLIIAMTDIEKIGEPVEYDDPQSDDPQVKITRWENGVCIRTGINTEIRDCHLEWSDVGIGITSGDGHIFMESCFLGACLTGVKQLFSGSNGGKFYFKNIRFTDSVKEFDIPTLTVYQIEDCLAKYGTGANKSMVIDAHPNLGTIKDVVYTPSGYFITYQALGLSINNMEVWKGRWFNETVNIGTVAANSSVQIPLTISAGYSYVSLNPYVDKIMHNLVFPNNVTPPGILIEACVASTNMDPVTSHTRDIVLNISNVTGSDIYMGTPTFAFRTVQN